MAVPVEPAAATAAPIAGRPSLLAGCAAPPFPALVTQHHSAEQGRADHNHQRLSLSQVPLCVAQLLPNVWDSAGIMTTPFIDHSTGMWELFVSRPLISQSRVQSER